MLADALPVEILLEIFTLLAFDLGARKDEPRRGNLLSAARVCKYWHQLTQKLIDQTIDLTLSPLLARQNLVVLRRLEDNELHGRTIHLKIRDWFPAELPVIGSDQEVSRNPWLSGGYFSKTFSGHDIEDAGTALQLTAVSDVLSSAKLRTFTWSAVPFPPASILQALASATTEFHVRTNEASLREAAWTYTPLINWQHLNSLSIVAQNIVTLEVCMPTEPEDDQLLMRELSSVIGCCSKLQHLQIHAVGRLSSCERLQWPLSPRAAEVSAQIWQTGPVASLRKARPGWLTLPQLTTLKLKNFCQCSGQRSFDLNTRLLRTLEVSCLALLPQRTLNLECLTLHLAERSTDFRSSSQINVATLHCETVWTAEQIDATLSKIHEPRELHVFGWPETVIDSLATLGLSLRSLTILHAVPPDIYCLAEDSPFLQQTESMLDTLHSVGQKCPKLRRLVCDAPPSYAMLFRRLPEIFKDFCSHVDELHLRGSHEPYMTAEMLDGDLDVSVEPFNDTRAVELWDMFNIARDHNSGLRALEITFGRCLPWSLDCATQLINVPSTASAARPFHRGFHITGDCRRPDVLQLDIAEAETAVRQGRTAAYKLYWPQMLSYCKDFDASEVDIAGASSEELIFTQQVRC